MNECNKMEIPNKLKVGGQDLNVVFKDTIYGDKMGECCIWSGNIQISEIYKGEPQTDSSKFNTFYHELIHAWQHYAGLEYDEQQAQVFGNFLQEFMETKTN
jgi:Zn-dependent peptidase ImmA (M78 family)